MRSKTALSSLIRKSDSLFKMETDKEIRKTGLRLVRYLRNREASAPEKIEDEVWERILSEIRFARNRRRYWLYGTSVAACLLLLVGLFVAHSFRPSDDSLLQAVASMETKPIETIQEIRLYTSSGDSIEVDSQSQVISHEKGGAVYVDKKQVATIPAAPEKQTDEAITYNEVIVPKGKHIRLALSDGSTMHINSGSRVVYPHKFQPEKREIYIEGEIYIDVQKQEGTPFIVRTKQFAVNVLGTAFNVRSYPDEAEAEIVLQRGKVEVEDSRKQTVTMTPDELVTLNAGTYAGTQEVDASEYITWTEGILVFKGENMEKAVKRLNHFYGEQINYTPQAGKVTVYGKLDINEPLEVALEALASTAGLTVSKQEGRIEITKRE